MKVCELDLKNKKIEQRLRMIFTAFTYLFMDFILLSHKSHKIKHTFKMHD